MVSTGHRQKFHFIESKTTKATKKKSAYTLAESFTVMKEENNQLALQPLKTYKW